ncbi:hypothetical protein MPER_12947 [Moniliophthora perniciosa FA553]|nr:hypothetical protein MPER_12947 [Moniliophthora perniciosa FA553]
MELDKGKKRAYKDRSANSSSEEAQARKRTKEGTSVPKGVSEDADCDQEQLLKQPKSSKASRRVRRVVSSDEEGASDGPDKRNRVSSEGQQSGAGKRFRDQVRTAAGEVADSDSDNDTKSRKAKRGKAALKPNEHDIAEDSANEGLQSMTAPKPQKAPKAKSKASRADAGNRAGDESDADLDTDNGQPTAARKSNRKGSKPAQKRKRHNIEEDDEDGTSDGDSTSEGPFMLFVEFGAAPKRQKAPKQKGKASKEDAGNRTGDESDADLVTDNGQLTEAPKPSRKGKLPSKAPQKQKKKHNIEEDDVQPAIARKARKAPKQKGKASKEDVGNGTGDESDG